VVAATAAAPISSVRHFPPRIMIAGGEKSGKHMPAHVVILFVFLPSSSCEPLQNGECFLLSANFLSGKSSIAKILGNYAVRIGQKPVSRCRLRFYCCFFNRTGSFWSILTVRGGFQMFLGPFARQR
jgi:hypothetical protein